MFHETVTPSFCTLKIRDVTVPLATQWNVFYIIGISILEDSIECNMENIFLKDDTKNYSQILF